MFKEIFRPQPLKERLRILADFEEFEINPNISLNVDKGARTGPSSARFFIQRGIKVDHLSPIPYLPPEWSANWRDPFRPAGPKVKFNLLLRKGEVLTKTRDPCNLLSPLLPPDRIIFPPRLALIKRRTGGGYEISGAVIPVEKGISPFPHGIRGDYGLSKTFS